LMVLGEIPVVVVGVGRIGPWSRNGFVRWIPMEITFGSKNGFVVTKGGVEAPCAGAERGSDSLNIRGCWSIIQSAGNSCFEALRVFVVVNWSSSIFFFVRSSIFLFFWVGPLFVRRLLVGKDLIYVAD